MSVSAERWEARRYDLHVLTALFGTADAVRVLGSIRTKAAALMRAWLTGVEALVRRTLLFDALALISTLTMRAHDKRPPSAQPREPHQTAASFRMIPAHYERPFGGRQRGPMRWTRTPEEERSSLIPDLPDPWTQRPQPLFYWVSDPALSSEHRKQRTPLLPPGFIRTNSLARRLDAIARILTNPAPHARRLARLLQAKGRATAKRMLTQLTGLAAKWVGAAHAEDVAKYGVPDLSVIPTGDTS